MMNEKKFLELYQRQQESGLTVKEFCANNLIGPSTFFYWKKKLEGQQRLPDFIPVVVNSSPTSFKNSLPTSSQSNSFIGSNENPCIEIEFSNKTILRIKSELNLSVLKALIHLND